MGCNGVALEQFLGVGFPACKKLSVTHIVRFVMISFDWNVEINVQFLHEPSPAIMDTYWFYKI
ncbi:MAG: hypothetical protein ACKVH9_09450, partial [Rhodobacterales bacterium]